MPDSTVEKARARPGIFSASRHLTCSMRDPNPLAVASNPRGLNP
ncbi:hypothetical protein D554_2117 [Bordetella holmesii 30539]|uniref:N-acetyltransferase YedL n=1 Tax=Bordetella holmesii 1058 TaxID=1247648 RepID=A0ABN0S0M1_9BORD|nr:hypothetical protein D560_0589 [Bordetella holmesii ATCC 51541]AIT25268.1 hypothetical protein D558_0579 [Bordetella holmesii 44057]EWM45831.1 hypothetical protein D557_3839 [Bordetella holmesii 70147]EWM48857.1 hypothetical protein D556_0582 [Bordetella holmesii 41130]EWM49961.1 hypothetical protein D555_0589 [Bordetella holmesii 35009]EXF86864.1 hypothetical protein D554_2117 [Bordetella holmesii 30539]EXX95111.1 hypothetical protein D559_2538 [Bordetella holmesii 1058]